VCLFTSAGGWTTTIRSPSAIYRTHNLGAVVSACDEQVQASVHQSHQWSQLLRQDRVLLAFPQIFGHTVHRDRSREYNWCLSENAEVPREQLVGAGAKQISYHQGVPHFDNTPNRFKLIILDDLLNEVYSKDVCDVFTEGNHHRNSSVIFITQNLFHQERFCRDILLNAKYLVVFKNVRDKNQFAYLS
jgi:hypothetical protein